jgi:perosamine synthetase
VNISEILLSDPDITASELQAVDEALRSPQLSSGPLVGTFEQEFAQYCNRTQGVAVNSSTIALAMILRAQHIGMGDEVIVSSYSWHEIAHAILLVGAVPILVDINYWTGTIDSTKVTSAITSQTRALIAGNNNGHPASWAELRQISGEYGLILIEDSTEAIGSLYRDVRVGGFGDCAIFDFSQPSSLICGEAAMIVTDDADLAMHLRHLRCRKIDERASIVMTAITPWRASISDISAALGLSQLRRLDSILYKRQRVANWYYDYVQSFEGIKPPYIGDDATQVNWMFYMVHLGTRFSRSSRDAIIEDLRKEGIDSYFYAAPLHQQRRYLEFGNRRELLRVTEKIADRALVLPFHTHLTENHVAFIVETLKDASINVGAGAAIYL